MVAIPGRKLTIGTAGTSAISIVLTFGGTSTRNCSTRSEASSHQAGEMFGNWRRPTSFPEPRSPVSSSQADGPIAQRQQARREWLEAVRRKLERADLLFLDPDNGLEPAGFRPTAAKSGKSIMISELHQLARPGRCLIVYHHQSRRAGGHHAEMQHWADRLRASGFATVDALRARPFSPRVYFLLDAPALIRQRAKQIAVDWQDCITWHPGGNVEVAERSKLVPRP